MDEARYLETQHDLHAVREALNHLNDEPNRDRLQRDSNAATVAIIGGALFLMVTILGVLCLALAREHPQVVAYVGVTTGSMNAIYSALMAMCAGIMDILIIWISGFLIVFFHRHRGIIQSIAWLLLALVPPAIVIGAGVWWLFFR
jgi:hypothetical protein